MTLAPNTQPDPQNYNSTAANYMWLWFPSGLAAACCGYVAIGHPSEYGFYTAARITVTIAACLLAYTFYKKNQEIKFSCVGLAIVFNPVVTLHLGRGLWVVADFLAIAVLIISTWQVQKNE